MTNHYENPLVTRYASSYMTNLWSTEYKIRMWRELWTALAESQKELGLTTDDGKPRITQEQTDQMAQNLGNVNLDNAKAYERELRHDVMAHIKAFGDDAPLAREIIHLGATSCFVTDNADLIIMRHGLDELCNKLARVIGLLGHFAFAWRDTPTLGFTHFQPAQLTTVGKRATLWCHDLVLDLQELEHRRDSLLARGAKGTTGTQASFLKLFKGDHKKVLSLDIMLAYKMGFNGTVPVCGQTYSRKFDSQIMDALGGIGSSVHKWGNDLRLLAHRQEIDEPFEKEQVGSSAMAYKRNPMRAERMCSLSRFLMGLPAMAAQTHATQWFERTLDDSACRRLYIPQAFLAADAILNISLNLASGLIVNKEIIGKGVDEYMPYMATENLLMAAVAGGQDRQKVHEVIREKSVLVTDNIKKGFGKSQDLLTALKASSVFAYIDFDEVTDPNKYIGRSVEQVQEFIYNIVEPINERYSNRKPKAEALKV